MVVRNSRKPTQKELKEFWEWCGFRQDVDGLYILPDCKRWTDRSGASINVIQFLPKLDLNNLFKYAVPKLQDKGYMVELYSYEQKGYKVSIYHITGQVDIPVVITTNEESALALYQAIRQVMEEVSNGR